LTAQFDQAQAYGVRLQQIASDNPDLEIKQAEAFAFLGNDEQVWAAYERAKTRLDELPPLLLHLAAVASYRQGDEKTAWKLWQQAKKRLPSFGMAQDCLIEKRLPIGERNIPWYWSFQYWLSQDFEQLLTKHLGASLKRMNDKSVDRAMKALLAERPYLPQLFPHLLEHGDRQTREFVLHFIRIVKTPDMLQTLYDFAQSSHGSDDLRLEAVQFISQNYPTMLPEDKQVPMWMNGQQTEMLMLGFEITDEPEEVEGVSQEILTKHETAYDLLMEDKPKEAEMLLHEIIAEAPQFYSAYNQLGVAYERQGRRAEARQLVEETHHCFPDYFFARIALARIAVQEKQIEKARELIQPLLRLRKLHISEFRALAQAQMDVALADEKPKAARTWLQMWQQLEEDNPELMLWQLRINGPGKLGRGLQKLLGRS
jgi:tetratricopeptide (TPR) repeat protein